MSNGKAERDTPRPLPGRAGWPLLISHVILSAALKRAYDQGREDARAEDLDRLQRRLIE